MPESLSRNNGNTGCDCPLYPSTTPWAPDIHANMISSHMCLSPTRPGRVSARAMFFPPPQSLAPWVLVLGGFQGSEGRVHRVAGVARGVHRLLELLGLAGPGGANPRGRSSHFLISSMPWLRPMRLACAWVAVKGNGPVGVHVFERILFGVALKGNERTSTICGVYFETDS